MFRRGFLVGVGAGLILMLTPTEIYEHEIPVADPDHLVVEEAPQINAERSYEPQEPLTATATGSSRYVPPEPVQAPPAYDPCVRDEWGVLHSDDCNAQQGNW